VAKISAKFDLGWITQFGYITSERAFHQVMELAPINCDSAMVEGHGRTYRPDAASSSDLRLVQDATSEFGIELPACVRRRELTGEFRPGEKVGEHSFRSSSRVGKTRDKCPEGLNQQAVNGQDREAVPSPYCRFLRLQVDKAVNWFNEAALKAASKDLNCFGPVRAVRIV